MLNKQVQIYSVDTKVFYNEKEDKINKELSEAKITMNLIKEYTLYNDVKGDNPKYDFKNIDDLKGQKNNNKYAKKYINQLIKDNKIYMKTDEFKDMLKSTDYEKYKELHKNLGNKLKDKIKTNTKIRELNESKVNKYSIIALFENDLSRTLGLETGVLSTDLIVIKILHYEMLKQLTKDGFNYLGEHFITLTSSAGQIRNKKIVMIKKDAWDKYCKTIMCGLTIEDINNSSEKGCNINKFLSYLALCNSATDEWKGFDIDRAIVIPDFETEVEGTVDFIDNKTFTVEPKPMKVPITHSDGCGWILPTTGTKNKTKSEKNFMVRLPWVKGLLTPCNYLKFCAELNNEDYKITDIYGKEWDLKKDNIKYVFSKSQFKMWKYYPNIKDENENIVKYGWDTYKENFKQYGCHANKCNIEKDTFDKANFNYQMWQTLLDIKDEEIKEFTDKIDNLITKAYTDKDTMLRLLGATKDNENMNYLQEALMIYPNLLQDAYIKHELSEVINKKRNDSKYGKFRINATYTYLLPDIFSWMKFVFAKDKTKEINGLLENGEVYCRLYKEKELLVNRSPHLFREHAARKNVTGKALEKWFITDGIYTSCKDLISKVLQFDNDGDKALVILEPTLIKIAKRNMKGILPLYYEMGKAEPKEINADNIYESLTSAFKYGNIGKYSNQLTTLWNTTKVGDDLTLHKIITALNNFSIDAAKTLLMPKIPKDINNQMKQVNKTKLPYFFQFVKDKDKAQVEAQNESTVNRICKNIENIKQGDYDFGSIEKFKSSMLMNNSKTKINNEVIEEYNRLNDEMQKYFMYVTTFASDNDEEVSKERIGSIVYNNMHISFNQFCKNKNIKYDDAVDMILKNIYKNNPQCKKAFIFNVFGDVILRNIKKNLEKVKKIREGYIFCKECGKSVKKESNRQTRCKECSEEEKKRKKLERQKITREKEKKLKNKR